MENKNIKSSYEYVMTYSDKERFREYRKAHFTDTEMPPVVFKANGIPSTAYKWEKKIGQIATYTDFPTDGPVKRSARHDIYTCAELGIEVDLEITEYPELPIIEYLPFIKNISGKNSPVITELCAIDECIMDGVKLAYVHHNNGDTFHNGKESATICEYASYTDEMGYLGGKTAMTLSSTIGFPTSHHLPNFNIEDKANERGVIAVLSWAGNWKADFSISTNTQFRLRAGQLHTEFVLYPDEKVRTPMVVLLFYKGGRFCGQNIWRYWYYKYNVLRKYGKRMTTNVLYCTTSDSNGMLNGEEEALDTTRLICDLGINDEIDFINQDAGWYDANGAANWTYIGNWYSDTKRCPHGLKAIGDLAHAGGMKFSVWFEPERMIEGTDIYRRLDGRAICPLFENGKFKRAKNGEVPHEATLMNDYSDPEAVKITADMLEKIIRENGIDQMRQDENFWTLWEYWAAKDNTESEDRGIPRYGLTEANFVIGCHRVWEILLERMPWLLIDSCAGGGRRNDLETVRMSFIHTRSDDYSSTENAQEQTYGMSMWYMLQGSALLRYDDKYDCRSRLTSSNGILIPQDRDMNKLRKALAEWKNYMTMFFSNYYPLTPLTADRDAILAMQFDDIDSGRGMIPVYVRKSGTITVKPMGLCPDCEYEYLNEDAPDEVFTVSGKQLMEEGITVSSDTKYAFMYLYKRK